MRQLPISRSYQHPAVKAWPTATRRVKPIPALNVDSAQENFPRHGKTVSGRVRATVACANRVQNQASNTQWSQQKDNRERPTSAASEAKACHLSQTPRAHQERCGRLQAKRSPNAKQNQSKLIDDAAVFLSRHTATRVQSVRPYPEQPCQQRTRSRRDPRTTARPSPSLANSGAPPAAQSKRRVKKPRQHRVGPTKTRPVASQAGRLKVSCRNRKRNKAD